MSRQAVFEISGTCPVSVYAPQEHVISTTNSVVRVLVFLEMRLIEHED